MTTAQKEINFSVLGFYYLVQSDGNLNDLNSYIDEVVATECIYPIPGYCFKTAKITNFAKSYKNKHFTHIPCILYSDKKNHVYYTHSLCLFSLKDHVFEAMPGYYYSIIQGQRPGLINQ
jgi:hypothetical protein